jgi:hypothetical protein
MWLALTLALVQAQPNMPPRVPEYWRAQSRSEGGVMLMILGAAGVIAGLGMLSYTTMQETGDVFCAAFSDSCTNHDPIPFVAGGVAALAAGAAFTVGGAVFYSKNRKIMQNIKLQIAPTSVGVKVSF